MSIAATVLDHRSWGFKASFARLDGEDCTYKVVDFLTCMNSGDAAYGTGRAIESLIADLDAECPCKRQHTLPALEIEGVDIGYDLDAMKNRFAKIS